MPELYTNTGLLEASFYTTVFDETGRPVSRHATADIFTQDVFHGMKTDGSYYYPLNQPVRIQLASADRNGNGVNAKAIVQVIKHEYRTVLTRSGGYFRYESQEDDKELARTEMMIGSNTTYQYVPRTPGDYEVRIYRPGSQVYVSKHFYSYGAWGGDNSSFEVNTEGHIDIELDKGL